VACARGDEDRGPDYLAFAFFALILLHVAAALFPALVRRDGVFESMAPVPPHGEVVPAE
jgi:cytochrome b561